LPCETYINLALMFAGKFIIHI